MGNAVVASMAALTNGSEPHPGYAGSETIGYEASNYNDYIYLSNNHHNHHHNTSSEQNSGSSGNYEGSDAASAYTMSDLLSEEEMRYMDQAGHQAHPHLAEHAYYDQPAYHHHNYPHNNHRSASETISRMSQVASGASLNNQDRTETSSDSAVSLMGSESRVSSASRGSFSCDDSEESESCRDERRARALNLPIPTEAIINLPIDEFNELLTKHVMSEAQLSLVRDIRRRGKNKVAAQNCRKRKMDQILGLQDEVNLMFAQKNSLEARNHQLMATRHVMREKFNQLCTFLTHSQTPSTTASSTLSSAPEHLSTHRRLS